MRVTAVRDAREARKLWPIGHYHLVVLDLMLPGESGLDLARWLRSQSDVPIVMLTAMGEETDRIIGLELGADDYLPQAVQPARAAGPHPRRAAPRRRAGHDRRSRSRRTASASPAGRWSRRAAACSTRTAPRCALTGGEYDLLLALVERANRVLTRDMLLDLLRGRQAGPVRPGDRRRDQPAAAQAGG